jgi:hypothetical protein
MTARLTLAAVVARCPRSWGIAQLDGAIQDEIPAYLTPWRVAVTIYSGHGRPYGDSPHGVLRFLEERRG